MMPYASTLAPAPIPGTFGALPSGPPPAPAYAGYAPPVPEMCEIFVDVVPELTPQFSRGPDGTFILELQPFRVRLTTTCTPPLPSEPGLSPYKPYEEFAVHLPEMARVVFDPANGIPANASAVATVRKRGAVLEAPTRVSLSAQIKSNSPYGSLVLEDLQLSNGFKQKVGENTLTYRLQVDAQLSVNKGGGNNNANRLEVDLNFTFSCRLVAGSASLAPQGVPAPCPPPIGSGPAYAPLL